MVDLVSEFLLVRVSVWLACAGWFAGACCRLWSPRPGTTAADSSATERRVQAGYAWSWWFGSLFLLVHIAASYGFVYDWSHREAVAATAEESFRVTGVRAGWGVYVNLVFALSWLSYSIVLLKSGRRNALIDRSVYIFLAAIVASATVLFEEGFVRYSALLGFAMLAGFHIRRSLWKHNH